MNSHGRKIALLFLGVGFSMNYGCQSNSGRTHTPLPDVSASTSSSEKQNELDIKSIEFFTWRGEGSRRSYTRIETLDRKDATLVTGPERFDVIIHVENKGRSSIKNGDLILVTTMEFVEAPGNPNKKNVREVIAEYSWSRDHLVDDLKMVLVPFLETSKQGRIEFSEFDLSSSNRLLRDNATISHIWAIKVTVHVLDRTLTQILQREAIISVPSPS